jgi:hypothetical protein
MSGWVRFGRSSILVAFLSVASVSLPSAPLSAQAGATPTDAQRVRARELYAEGQAHFDAGRFEEARTAFEAAYREVPNPVVLLGVASAEERLGRNLDAARTLRRYLRQRVDAPDRTAIAERITALDPSGATAQEESPAASTLRVTSTPEGATIGLDGQATGQVTPAELTVSPGDHTLTLSLDGYESISETITMTPGDTSEWSPTLSATPTTPSEEGGLEGEADVFGAQADGSDVDAAADESATSATVSGDPSTGVWVTTGVAGVGLVTGTVFGFLALSAQSDFDVNPTADTADRGETFALVADLAFGVAIAAGITAIVLYATDRQAQPDADVTTPREGAVRVSVAPWGGPNGGGAAMALQF